MEQDNNSVTKALEPEIEPKQEQVEEQEIKTASVNEKQKDLAINEILGKLGVSDAVATSAKAILDPVTNGNLLTQGLVELVVKALSHDEDVKNAEAAGYLRGRNETIEVASKLDNDNEPVPVNFPVYRKRSFWDR